jgi:hypothetical protein
MRQQSLWEQHKTVAAGIQSLPTDLRKLLQRHEAATLCSDWLKSAHPVTSFRDTTGAAVFQWDMVGMAFASQGRTFEAISIHRELYHLMCEAQEHHGWIHKGHPLVRLRDWHRQLGHPWHEERYLLLTLIEDAIRDQGKIDVARGGIYHRFRWEEGRSDREFRQLAEGCWKEFSENSDLREFPEEIVPRLGSTMFKRAAAQTEVDLYEINTVYASKLFKRASQGDWRCLERLAAYQLMCVPGFEVERQKSTEGSTFDVFIRIRGNYVDFRRELGTYMLGECKNWKDPVGPNAIAYLAQNLTFHECSAGILFSWSGITGTDKAKFAALTVLRAYHHSGRIILVLNKTDFRRASRGEALQEMLRQKYEQVRFDLPTARTSGGLTADGN